jgi:transposase-like protein
VTAIHLDTYAAYPFMFEPIHEDAAPWYEPNVTVNRLGIVKVRRSLAERFWDKVDVSADLDGCWVWTRKPNTTGYGQFAVLPDKMTPSHRMAYELLVGPIPDGMFLDHLCHNRARWCRSLIPEHECRHRLCVNPLHLEPVPPAVNVKRGGDMIIRCPQGHEYTPENTYRNATGQKTYCVTCHRDKAREAYVPRTTPNRWSISPEIQQRVLRLHAEGTSLRGIGRELGIARHRAAKIVAAAAETTQARVEPGLDAT